MAYRKSTREASQCRTSPADPADGLAAQTLDLRAAGAEKVFREQATSIGPREALKRCQDYLRKGDALVVATPDRLAHSVVSCWRSRRICRSAASVLILSIGGERLDTREPASKRVLDTLAGVAAWQR